MSTTDRQAYDELVAHLRQMSLVASFQERIQLCVLTVQTTDGQSNKW